MPTLRVELSEDREALITHLIESGQFNNAGEVVLEGLRLVEADRKTDAEREQAMREAIRSGLDDLSEGRFVTLESHSEITGHVRSLGERAARTK